MAVARGLVGLVAGGLLALGIAGGSALAQASYPMNMVTEGTIVQSGLNQPVSAGAASATGSVSRSMSGDAVGSLDVLRVEVYGVPELSRDVEVNAAGLISLPLIGDVQAQGLVTVELAHQIEERYRGRYIKSPSVSVRTLERRSWNVVVNGAVRRPGRFALNGRSTLSQAVAFAEGTTDESDLRAVRLFRQTAQGVQATEHDLRAILEGRAADPILFPNDQIVVGVNRGRVSVAGAVSRPNVFVLEEDLSLTRAVALAGGHTAEANLKKVVLVREANGTRAVEEVSLKDIFEGRAADRKLVDGDVIIVPTSQMRLLTRDIAPIASIAATLMVAASR